MHAYALRSMRVDAMDIKDLLELMRGMKDNHIAFVKLDREDETITLKRHKKAKTITATSIPELTLPMQDVTEETLEVLDVQAAEVKEALVGEIVTAPVVGVFFAAPSPESSPFVELGGDVKTGDIVCIIEAMKLFNEIESEVSGKIVKVLVENATPVEFDQPLFLVDPAG